MNLYHQDPNDFSSFSVIWVQYIDQRTVAKAQTHWKISCRWTFPFKSWLLDITITIKSVQIPGSNWCVSQHVMAFIFIHFLKQVSHNNESRCWLLTWNVSKWFLNDLFFAVDLITTVPIPQVERHLCTGEKRRQKHWYAALDRVRWGLPPLSEDILIISLWICVLYDKLCETCKAELRFRKQ